MSVDAARRLLAVAADADPEALKSARNRAMMRAHPDHGGTEEALRQVLEAYELLEGWRSVGETPEDLGDSLCPRLEISPSLAMNGGRHMTRLADGRKVALTLPAGLRTGDKISAGGSILNVAIAGRPDLFVSGDDLCMVVKTEASLLANGGRLKVKTPGGVCMIWVPRQVGGNRIVRVLGRGLPARGRHAQGALLLKLVTENAKKESPTKAKRKRFGADWAAA